MALISPSPVHIYTTPTCPDCRSLKLWLASKGIRYTEYDLTDPQIADRAKSTYGVRVAPITVIGDAVFYGTFADQLPGLRKLLDQEEAV